jgi:hypothetical protein
MLLIEYLITSSLLKLKPEADKSLLMHSIQYILDPLTVVSGFKVRFAVSHMYLHTIRRSSYLIQFITQR